ncbi:MAG: hypothetical protein ABJE95_22750 [Byssovorax sp.]
MRRRSWSSEIGSLAIGVLGALSGCKSKSAPAEAVALTPSASAPAASAEVPLADAAAPDAAAPTGVGMDAGRSSDAGPDFAGGECPNFDPERWTPYTQLPTESACWIFTPSAKEKMPVLAWEPCGREGFGAKCRKLKLAPGETIAFHGRDNRAVDVEGKGPGRISIVMGCAGMTSRQMIVADLDGPVTGAVAFDSDWRCSITPGLRSSGWGADIQFEDPHPTQPQNEWEGTPRLSFFLTAARAQLVPTKHEGSLDSQSSSGSRDLAAWSKLPKSAKEEAALGFPPGIKPEIHVATDGEDVVWSVGDLAQGERGTCGVFTGHWTSDPAEVVATHVVDLSCVETGWWNLRCGYAATTTGEEQGLLVRLKDGMTFRFPKLSAPLDRGMAATTSPMDLTCKELFLRVGGPHPNVFRVPLDALPEGTPPGQPPSLIARADAGAPVPSSDGGTDAGTDAGPRDAGR